MIKNANLLDPADKSGQLTYAGRALEKHGSRTSSVFPKATGNVLSKNQQGLEIVKTIVNDPNRLVIPNKGLDGLQIYGGPNNGGVLFIKSDNSFLLKGFREPK